MATIISFLFAGVATVVAILFGLATMNNPYNDLTRVYTRAFTILFGLAALGLWILGGVLVARSGRAHPEDDDWYGDVEAH